MSVYVDQVQEWGARKGFKWTRSCHMYADTVEELHAMADAIGMRREWFQDHARLPHYDLVPARRARAVALGAVEHDRHQMEEFMRRGRGELSGNLFGGGG